MLTVQRLSIVFVFIGVLFAASIGKGEGGTARPEPTFGMIDRRVHIYVPVDAKLTIDVIPAKIAEGPELSVSVRNLSKAGAPILLGFNNYVDWVNATPKGGSITFQSGKDPTMLQLEAFSKIDGYHGRDPWTTAGLVMKAHDPSRRVAIFGVDGQRDGTYNSATVTIRW